MSVTSNHPRWRSDSDARAIPLRTAASMLSPDDPTISVTLYVCSGMCAPRPVAGAHSGRRAASPQDGGDHGVEIGSGIGDGGAHVLGRQVEAGGHAFDLLLELRRRARVVRG